MQLHLLKGGDWWGIITMAIGLGSLEVVLEEGNRKDWFASEEIWSCCTLIIVKRHVKTKMLTSYYAF
jgi:DHA2 family multidrug resistance protein